MAAWLGVVSSASAAFPGGNGLLAVQPLHGSGIVLVANGGPSQRICTNVAVCGHPLRPRFSPDGRSIVFAGAAVRLIGTDGSCQNCRFGRARNPAFLPGGARVSFVLGAALLKDGIDGLRLGDVPTPGAVSDAVWSASGALAVVAGGRVWAGRQGALRQVGTGSGPSWSPDASRLAFARRGWITILRVRTGSARPLVRGTAPAFSPDGRWIAYIDPSRRLRVVSSSGGRSRTVSGVRGLSVDWQPIPSNPPPCVAPPGARVLARSDEAVVTTETAAKPTVYAPMNAAMGCLLADGRERLLSQSPLDADGTSLYTLAALGGHYAALNVFSDRHYGPDPSEVSVYDLRTGQKSGFGGEQAMCDSGAGTCNKIDHLVVGPDGVSAAHVDGGQFPDPLSVLCASASLCLGFTGSGHVVSTTNPSSGPWSPSTLVVNSVGTSCASESLCVLTAGPDVYTSTNPAGGADAWSTRRLPSLPIILAVDCPSTTLCVGTTRDGQVVVSTNPTGDASAWSVEHVDGDNEMFGIACPTTTECIATDDHGNVITSTDPTGGASAWTVRKSGSSGLGRVRCPSPSLCIATGSGKPLVSTDPIGGSWTATAGPVLEQLECPSVSLCVGIDSAFKVEISTDPASGSWTGYSVSGAGTLESLSCPTTSFCAAAGYGDGHVLLSTNAAGGPATWTRVLADQVSCEPTPGACGTEQIVASDRTGVHTLDSSTEFEIQTGPQLTALTLTGDTLSWNHSGSPRTAQLTP